MGCCDRAKNVIEKAVDVVGKILIGERATELESWRRLDVCSKCELMRKKRGIGLWCGKIYDGEPRVEAIEGCGCNLSLKTKLASEHCPQGKW